MADPSKYPPAAYLVEEPEFALRMMREHPVAHFITGHNGLRSAKIPILADQDETGVISLRSHLDRFNPQTENLDGKEVLISFSGPSAYISPNWRANKKRGGTIDYLEVQVRGTAKAESELNFFYQLINDLSALLESQNREVADYPIWTTSDVPPGYLDKQFPLVLCFTVEVSSITTIAKLHQNFPEADRRSISEHLARSKKQDFRAIGLEMQAYQNPIQPA